MKRIIKNNSDKRKCMIISSTLKNDFEYIVQHKRHHLYQKNSLSFYAILYFFPSFSSSHSKNPRKISLVLIYSILLKSLKYC